MKFSVLMSFCKVIILDANSFSFCFGSIGWGRKTYHGWIYSRKYLYVFYLWNSVMQSLLDILEWSFHFVSLFLFPFLSFSCFSLHYSSLLSPTVNQSFIVYVDARKKKYGEFLDYHTIQLFKNESQILQAVILLRMLRSGNMFWGKKKR